GAIGARVVALVGEKKMLRLCGTQSGFLSSCPATLHWGLGEASQVDELQVTWPDGLEESFSGVEAGHVSITQGSGLTRTDTGD
ncbi:MAG: ASPIC/UnbV domain-containing protein, partial [bacterium]